MGGKKRQVEGIMYYLGFHIVLCHYGKNITINKIAAGERPCWSGAVSSNTRISINQPNLFGGHKKEGGIQGPIDIMMGAEDQPRNSYLTSKIGANIPAFRGVVSMVANQIYCCAGSPYVKPWWIQGTSIVQEDWYAAKANLNSGSANAAHIIRECLLNLEWGMGIPSEELNDDAFVVFADTIYDEDLGLSLLLSNTDKIDKFIAEVLRHVQGVIYIDRQTGLYVIKLIRGDYDIDAIPVFDEDNILEVVSYDKPSPGELLDEVIVKYRPRGLTKDSSIGFQNIATSETQNGRVSKIVEYPGIDTAANASKMGARELRQQSANISKHKIKTNREAWNLNVGGVFKWNWAQYKIEDVVMRIVKINFGTIHSPEIIIDAVQDVFALSDATYLDPPVSAWVDPVVDPEALIYQRVNEACWWDVYNEIDPANLALVETNTTASYLTFCGIQNVLSSGFGVWRRVGTSMNPVFDVDAGYTPDAFLVSDLNYTDTIDIEISDLDEIELDIIIIGQYAIIDEEYVRVDAIDFDAGTMEIGRGCLDTVAVEHAAGTRIWFAEDTMAKSLEEYASGVTIRAQARVETGLGLLDLSAANEGTHLFQARQNKPYPPGNLLINGTLMDKTIGGQDLLTLTWAHRDRITQTAEIIDQTAASIGPETNTVYELKLYDENNTLRKTESALTGTTYTWTTETADSSLSGVLNRTVRFTLTAVRDGVRSWQSHDFTVTRAGYGLNYGNDYGGNE